MVEYKDMKNKVQQQRDDVWDLTSMTRNERQAHNSISFLKLERSLQANKAYLSNLAEKNVYKYFNGI